MTTIPILGVPLGTGQETPAPFRGCQAPRAPTWLERILRIPRASLAEAELAAILADAMPTALSESRVRATLQWRRVSGKRAHAVLHNLWARALKAFLADQRLTDAEVGYLDALTRLFNLGFDEVEAIKASTIHPIYQRAVRDAVADGILTDQERAFLSRLAADLRLTPGERTKLTVEPAVAALRAKVLSFLSSSRFSHSDITELAAFVNGSGIQNALDHETQGLLQRYATLWQIENNGLPTVQLPIHLGSGEIGHLLAQGEWLELRSRATNYTYAGPVVSIPIMRGVRYRIGSFTPSVMRSDTLTRIDVGDFMVTNKRVLFRGVGRNLSLRVQTLIGIRVFSDGLVIEKASGRSPHIVLGQATEVAAVILSTLLAQSSE